MTKKRVYLIWILPIQFTIAILISMPLAAHRGIPSKPLDPLADFQTQVIIELSAELHDSFPDFAAVFAREAPKAEHEVDPVVRSSVNQLLKMEKSAPPTRKPALLLATDMLAGKLFCAESSQDPSVECRKLHDEMAAQKLTLAWDVLGGEWSYRHDLLWRVWREFGSTRWGEKAFVLLMNSGWNPSGICDSGKDEFRVVIREGEKFLAARPSSSYRPEIKFLVAEAHASWWAMSEPGLDDDYVDPKLYKEGSSQARRKAILYFQELADSHSNKLIVEAARQHLLNIKKGDARSEARFYCVYD